MKINPLFIDNLKSAHEKLAKNIELEKSKNNSDDKVVKMENALMGVKRLIANSKKLNRS